MTSHRLRQSPALLRGFVQAGDPPLAGRLYVQPVGLLSGPAADAAIAAGEAWPLSGGPLAFTALSLLVRGDGEIIETVASFASVLDWIAAEGEPLSSHVSPLIHRLGQPRPAFAGLALDRPLIMAVLNVTPDSFSECGDRTDPPAAIARAVAMLEAGADIVDVGGESTRPGAAPVAAADEIARTIPVIRALAERGATISIDTRHATVMAAALEAGAAIVNDITALADVGALALVAARGAAVVLMHMRGEPATMQDAPRYDHPALDVYDHLADRVAACRAAGIAPERICVDPGIGFGKTAGHNTQILNRLGLYQGLGCAMLLGVSRKSFIGRLSRGEAPRDRLPGSLAAALAGLDRGADILRVHDVAETAQAVAVWRAMRAAG